jgi:hypothetical protein
MIEDILRLGLVRLYTPETLGIVIALALSSFFGRFALSLFKKDDISELPLVNGVTIYPCLRGRWLAYP